MNVDEIIYGSTLYQKTLKLREIILRTPLSLALDPEDLVGEDSQFHFAIIQDDEPAACVVIKPLSPTVGKLRQMAVAEQRQGQNLGTQLIAEVERTLAGRGFHRIQCSARYSALGFYEKLNYTATGDCYLEQGVNHIAMHKSIRANAD